MGHSPLSGNQQAGHEAGPPLGLCRREPRLEWRPIVGLRIVCTLVTCALVSWDLLLLFLPTEFWGAPCLRVSLCTRGFTSVGRTCVGARTFPLVLGPSVRWQGGLSMRCTPSDMGLLLCLLCALASCPLCVLYCACPCVCVHSQDISVCA